MILPHHQLRHVIPENVLWSVYALRALFMLWKEKETECASFAYFLTIGVSIVTSGPSPLATSLSNIWHFYFTCTVAGTWTARWFSLFFSLYRFRHFPWPRILTAAGEEGIMSDLRGARVWDRTCRDWLRLYLASDGRLKKVFACFSSRPWQGCRAS